MFQLFRALSRTELAWRQAPAFTIAFVMAARWYHFGSFAREVVAFLFTWFVIDALVEVVLRLRRLSRSADGDLATSGKERRG